MRRTSSTVSILALAFAAQATAPERGRVLAVHAAHDQRASSIYVLGDRPLSFTTLKLAGPPRVVVDFADAEIATEDRDLSVGDGAIQRVALAAAGARTARLVIELSHDAEFEVRALESRVEVRIPRNPPQLALSALPDRGGSGAEASAVAVQAEPADEAAKRASLPEVALVGPHEVPRNSGTTPADDDEAEDSPAPPAKPAPARHNAVAGQRRAITGIGFRPVRGGEVIVRSDHPLEYGISGDGRAVLLHLPSAAIPLPNNRRPLDTHFFEGPVQRIVPLAVAGGTDVRIELKDTAEYQLEQTGSVLTVTFAPIR